MKNNDIYCLLVSKEDAKQLLSDRYDLGVKILNAEITTLAELEEANSKYENWRSYNITLLKKIFDNEILVDSHFPFPSIMSTLHKSLNEKKSLFFDDLNWHINKLKSTIGKIDLYEPKEKIHSTKSNDVTFSDNRVDNFFSKCKNHKVLSAFIIFFILIIGFATVTDSFSKLYDLFNSLVTKEVSEDKTTNFDEAPIEKKSSTSEQHESSEANQNKEENQKEEPISNYIKSLRIEVRLTCSLKKNASLPPSQAEFIPVGDANAYFDGSAGRVRCEFQSPVYFRNIGSDKITIINNFTMRPGGILEGRPFKYLNNFEKLILPIITIVYGDSFDKMTLLELTIEINGKQEWYKSWIYDDQFKVSPVFNVPLQEFHKIILSE